MINYSKMRPLWRAWFATLLLIVALVMTACGSAEPEPAPEPAATEAPAEEEPAEEEPAEEEAPAEDANAAGDEEIIIGLITKTETNPFFVKMDEGRGGSRCRQSWCPTFNGSWQL